MLLMACDNFYRGIGRTDVPMWFGFVKLFLNEEEIPRDTPDVPVGAADRIQILAAAAGG